jgi:quercetin dioxygenase-like cupin family protein
LLLSKALTIGDSLGTIYDFEKKGDILDKHVHIRRDVHYSIVARGSFKVYGDDFEQSVPAGTILDWDEGVNHGFIALEDNSRLINIIKYKM